MRPLVAQVLCALVVGCATAPEPPATCGYDLYQRSVVRDDACERGDMAACARVASVYEEGGYSVPTAPAVAAVLHAGACRAGVVDGCSGLARLAGAQTCAGSAYAACIERLCESNVVVHDDASLPARMLTPEQRGEIGCRP